MDPRFPPEAEAFRAEIRAFLAEHLPADWAGVGALDTAEATAFTEQWRGVLAEHGYLAPVWPKRYGGGGMSKLQQVVIAEEFAKSGVPTYGANDNFGIKMIGNLLLMFGTHEQKQHYLPRIINRQDRWCQGFSEPGAGSDLAAVKTSAALDGHEWVINGQKIWTSDATTANWIFLLARTDPDAPRHRGISMLLVPLDQPGIEIRPITMPTGSRAFNEVFFSDARTRADDVVLGVNQGWKAAMALLGLERGDEAATNPVLFRAEIDRLIALVQEHGLSGDEIVRDRLAHAYTKVEIMRFLGARMLTGWLRGDPPGTEASVSKLYWSEYHRWVTDLAMTLLGPAGLIPEGRPPLRHYRADDPGAPNSTASWSHTWLAAVSGTIYAGTSEIQRNILAESALGLPREARG
ncbi:acyl-CoA dehydrogenase family protein [Mycobacterium branderi]|uniref:Acyl-CoA dehydrogenase n=1 Tax=Mycobacterium branderi TaxID=43348 RepID=A0A7I7WCR4_9MYCO|nr:acyl-CoA dehydrogenase family protein [Mycobacterium branderi]MCV7231607.1 acyl-CoA dehydrogenase family protein [Mycobacterium branderi]ORA40400.1 acyl-CoA dehydrogenase [Mycobacterium branderi]BBZ14910.1 acyl-CoA dehydrogenase [Mycobacterium branderi]